MDQGIRTADECTGTGELVEYDFGDDGLQVEVDSDGNLTDDGATALGEVMRPESSGARVGGASNFNLTVFRTGDDGARFHSAASTIRAQIREGELNYNLFDCNCGDVANLLAAAAGARGFAADRRPNAQFNRELRSARGGSPNLWTLRVTGSNRVKN